MTLFRKVIQKGTPDGIHKLIRRFSKLKIAAAPMPTALNCGAALVSAADVAKARSQCQSRPAPRYDPQSRLLRRPAAFAHHQLKTGVRRLKTKPCIERVRIRSLYVRCELDDTTPLC